MNSFDRSDDPGAIEERAADWLTRRDAGMSQLEQQELERWLEADPRHRQAFAAIESAWLMVTRPARCGHRDDVMLELETLATRRRRRRQAGWGVVLSGAVAAALVFVWRVPPPLNDATPSSSAIAGIVARPERHLLDDGSAVELKAGAEFQAEFSPTERRVRLVRGTAHFDVASDAQRPFVVVAGSTTVRAIGTEFLVQLAAENIGVLVTEGLVHVAPVVEAETTPPVVVSAGRRATVARAEANPAGTRVEVVAPDAIAAALAWRTQRVEFSGLPLAEVLTIFNRSNRVQLVLEDPELSALRVSGIYWTDNPAGFAELIAASLDLRVERPAEGVISLQR